MAQNLKINGKQYNGVSVIGAPNANGGTSRFFDTSNATAEADDIAIGKTAYTINGKVTGTNQGGGSTLGTKTITVNGEYDAQDDGYDGYSSVDVQVPGSSPTLQAKTNIAPTTSSQTITADQGYDGLSSVQINAMPTGTAGTPTATKGAVSNHSISVTPSVTNSAGYIASGTINGTAVSVSASELDSGAKSITANGNSQDVVGYASVNVNVPNSYSAGDEGKVVSSGALVAQTAHADVTPTTSDQTIDTTTNNSLKVKGDANLVAGNIKKDVEIFGTTGSYEGGGGGFSVDDIAQNLAPNGDIVLGNIIIQSNALRKKPITSISGNATKISSESLRDCTSLTSIMLPNINANIESWSCTGCSNLEIVDAGSPPQIFANTFNDCKKLQTFIIRTTSVCALQSDSAFTNTPFKGYNGLTGVFYVPSSLINSYKTASNWSSLFNTGYCTFSAIEGSIYE